MSPQCLPKGFGSFQLTFLEQMWFGDFQDGCRGGHLGCQNRMILALFESLCSVIAHSTKLCCSDVSHQVSAPSNLWFRRWCRLKNFKMATLVTILDIGMEWCLKILTLHVSPVPPTKFPLNLTYPLGAYFRMAAIAAILVMGKELFKLVWISMSLWCLPPSFSSNWPFGKRCGLKNFKIAIMAAILDIWTERF